MEFTGRYESPLGEILLAADAEGLMGLWFAGQKYFAAGLGAQARAAEELPVFSETRRWLDIYFSGREPHFLPLLHLAGTPFQREVWELLLSIPYGATVTYGELAREVARLRGRGSFPARAVGGAVGRNRVSIIVPCHRVVGAKGALTGYAGGLWRKERLLELERGAGLMNQAPAKGAL